MLRCTSSKTGDGLDAVRSLAGTRRQRPAAATFVLASSEEASSSTLAR